MKKYQITLAGFVLIGLLGLTACKQIEPIVEKSKPVVEQVKQIVKPSSASTPAKTQITTQQMVDAIKQALSQGVNDSVYLLGSLEGFNLSQLYHIPIPDKLSKPAELLRKLGQGKKVDEFELRLNQSAQQAVQEATDVFTSAIQQMSVRDALSIMKGADNAATQYFRGKTETSLRNKFLPIISKATDRTGLTSTYKSIDQSINKVYPGNSYTMDIDGYVLDHAMDALFDRIAVEEKLIRQQPVKRTTDLMKEVFGYFAKK